MELTSTYGTNSVRRLLCGLAVSKRCLWSSSCWITGRIQRSGMCTAPRLSYYPRHSGQKISSNSFSNVAPTPMPKTAMAGPPSRGLFRVIIMQWLTSSNSTKSNENGATGSTRLRQPVVSRAGVLREKLVKCDPQSVDFWSTHKPAVRYSFHNPLLSLSPRLKRREIPLSAFCIGSTLTLMQFSGILSWRFFGNRETNNKSSAFLFRAFHVNVGTVLPHDSVNDA